MTWAKIGVKCICIKGGAWRMVKDGIRSPELPSFGEECVIDAIQDDYIWVAGYEGWFAICRFRPLTTKTIEDDISVFKRIADQVPNMEMQDEQV